MSGGWDAFVYGEVMPEGWSPGGAVPVSERVLIYGLVDPRTRLVRYVGKSMRGLARPRAHRRDPKSNPTLYVSRWIAQLQALGLDYEIAVLEFDPADPSEAECWWIAYGRASDWPLTNLTDGGEGAPGHKKTAESKERIAASKRGVPRSAETRARLSVANKLAAQDPAVRARLRAAALASPHGWPGARSDDARARMSTSAKNRDPASRARGYTFKQSEESKEKIRRASLAMWSKRRAA